MEKSNTESRAATQAASFPVFFHFLHALELLYERSSIHPQRAFFDAAEFPWTRELEASWPDILTELQAVLEQRQLIPNFQDISPEQQAITQDDRWKTYILHAYGARAKHNCRECPKTTAAIERIPGIKTAFFSILAAGKHIPAHRGPYKGLLRCHLGLIVPLPADSCRIRVDGTDADWQEGKTLLFDDTLTHEVWNNSAHDRVVLFIDFMRPMRPPISWINGLVMWLIRYSPYARSTAERFRRWYEQRGIAADVNL
jgi:ornithine lipid ester-linked acyl 2-hydroxylase